MINSNYLLLILPVNVSVIVCGLPFNVSFFVADHTEKEKWLSSTVVSGRGTLNINFNRRFTYRKAISFAEERNVKN